MESLITLVKDGCNTVRKFYVWSDGRAKETGHEVIIQDFAGFFLFLAGDGWRVAKEVNIPTPSRETPPAELPKDIISRKGAFAREWQRYLFGDNSTNLELC